MNTLAIDCTSSIMSVTLEKENSLFESAIHDGFKNSENLMPLIDSLFTFAKIKPIELDLIAVSLGPGSFTGLRIGFSTAKGIALGSNTPMIAVPSLDAYSRGYTYFDGLIVPVIDARKQRVYTSIYSNAIKKTDDMDISPKELLNILDQNEKVLITGPDSNLFSQFIENNNRLYVDTNFNSMASTSILRLGVELFQKNGPSPIGIGPLYIRKSEAEISLYGE